MSYTEEVQDILKSYAQESGVQAVLADKKLQAAKFVLLGESSHGTHEFYAYRAEITKRLIEEGNHRTLIVEADWPDMYRVNCYVRHESQDHSAEQALRGFERFPTWMWRNDEFSELIERMRDYNKGRSSSEQVAVYGMDLYSMERSISEVLKNIREQFPELELRARSYYDCFDHNVIDPQAYGRKTWLGETKACEEEVTKLLRDIQSRRADELQDSLIPDEKNFSLEQNARVVANAEAYYRALFRPAAISWNLRDQHMVESVKAISQFRKSLTGSDCAILWAHNSHLGDASVTDMGAQGEINVGQLLRETFGNKVFNLGLTTAIGQVIASRNWDSPGFVRKIKDPIEGSIEKHFADYGASEFYLSTAEPRVFQVLKEPLLQRAIGVIYRPETERWSHYFYAQVAKQFDGLLHVNESKALRPLDSLSNQKHDFEAESFPSGL